MSDLSQTYIASGGGADGTFYVTVPQAADLVSVTAGLDAAGSTASTVDVKVNGTTIFGSNANKYVVTGTTSSDAGSIASSKLNVAGDSASKSVSVKATDALTQAKNASDTRVVTNNVTSGVDFIGAQAPTDAVLKSVSPGDVIAVTTAHGTGVTSVVASLKFILK